VFSEAEASRLRGALLSARFLFGTWGCAAAALYVIPRTLRDAGTGRKPVTADLALRLARALGKTLDALLRPPSEAGTCPTCGRRS
jgi:plasmid maintenance system antidote protein VapI